MKKKEAIQMGRVLRLLLLNITMKHLKSMMGWGSQISIPMCWRMLMASLKWRMWPLLVSLT